MVRTLCLELGCWDSRCVKPGRRAATAGATAGLCGTVSLVLLTSPACMATTQARRVVMWVAMRRFAQRAWMRAVRR
ncbi:hypothetical protein CHLRE_10g422326v5 [Chlamydomonas reinhardtii]|uniref:Uncharacterized protein n=1 Tax=Chlamydomonas reinhardtii TaxID=3055 RepID=A0A2K3D9A5_CHLRE|nr:uncharacterized protein CHLRE_10g422326v5 [Chlamydomonas reinhardtii]PNW77105.1 hypothetical protein CHLRE_10g422326v5 [Chlamydomonas reinhardtii]